MVARRQRGPNCCGESRKVATRSGKVKFAAAAAAVAALTGAQRSGGALGRPSPSCRGSGAPGRHPGGSRAAERRPSRLSVEQGGLSPPGPSSVRPSQGAGRREQSGGLGAAGGDSDGRGSGDREVRKRGAGGSQGGLAERSRSWASRVGGVEGRTGRGWREGRGRARRGWPEAQGDCEAPGAGMGFGGEPGAGAQERGRLRARLRAARKAAGRGHRCGGRGRRTPPSGEPPFAGWAGEGGGREGRGKGSRTPRAGPRREGAAPGVSAAGISACGGPGG